MSGIWIRSQDKRLLLNVVLVGIKINHNIIYGATQASNTILELGKYLTEEKALKVLDKIQRHIEKLFTNTTDGNTNYHMFKQVFEMPQDDEV